MQHVDWLAIASKIGRTEGESEKANFTDGPAIACELIGREVLLEGLRCYSREEQGARTAGVLLKWLKPQIIIDDIRDLIAHESGAIRTRAVTLLMVVGEDDARAPEWIREYLSCTDDAVCIPAAEMLVYQVAVKARGADPRFGCARQSGEKSFFARGACIRGEAQRLTDRSQHEVTGTSALSASAIPTPGRPSRRAWRFRCRFRRRRRLRGDVVGAWIGGDSTRPEVARHA